MPTEKIHDPTTEGRYVKVSWRRRPGLDGDDQGTAPGYVQVATINERMGGGPRDDGWHVELDEAGIDRMIKALHKAKSQAFGKAPTFATGGVVANSAPLAAQLDTDEHILRDVTAVGDEQQLFICARREHVGQPCQKPAPLAEINAQPQPIRFVSPEVTVESDATAAARLDTDRYRATRRGDR